MREILVLLGLVSMICLQSVTLKRKISTKFTVGLGSRSGFMLAYISLNTNFNYLFLTMVHQIYTHFATCALFKALIVHKCSFLRKLLNQEWTLKEFITFLCSCVKGFQLPRDQNITLSTWTHFVKYSITSQFGPHVYWPCPVSHKMFFSFCFAQFHYSLWFSFFLSEY